MAMMLIHFQDMILSILTSMEPDVRELLLPKLTIQNVLLVLLIIQRYVNIGPDHLLNELSENPKYWHYQCFCLQIGGVRILDGPILDALEAKAKPRSSQAQHFVMSPDQSMGSPDRTIAFLQDRIASVEAIAQKDQQNACEHPRTPKLNRVDRMMWCLAFGKQIF